MPRLWTFVLLAAVTVSARAQLRLPALPIPLSPGQSIPQAVDQTTDRTLERLSAARRVEIARLIRDSKHSVEADPNGNPIVRGELLALSPTDTALDRARSMGFLLAREQRLADDLRVVVLRSPGMSTRRALDVLRTADPDGVYDYNHLYTAAGHRSDVDDGPGTASAPVSLVTETRPTAPNAAAAPRPHVRVGLLDTGVASMHPAFNDSTVHTWGCADKPMPSFHGTAVASLLVGAVGAVGADLYAADVYCGAATGGAVDAIVGAFGWMVSERVAVINVSLVGPQNALLEHTLNQLIARGYTIVAAVGNDGPTAPPLYPAAYPNVIGVTGVDAKRRVLIEAERGRQVMFAAPGADIKAANIEHALIDVRGTSFAAPTVAALLAQSLNAPDKTAAAAAVESLARRAIDLGPPGRDLTYGFGLVGAAVP